MKRSELKETIREVIMEASKYSDKWNEIRLYFKDMAENDMVSQEQQKIAKQGLAVMKKLARWV